jgi:hypothetical protein
MRAARDGFPMRAGLATQERGLSEPSRRSAPAQAQALGVRADKEPSKKALSAAAKRALAEAEERRSQPNTPAAPEINGRDGPDPVRYGDWEVKGLASDF